MEGSIDVSGSSIDEANRPIEMKGLKSLKNSFIRNQSDDPFLFYYGKAHFEKKKNKKSYSSTLGDIYNFSPLENLTIS